MSRYVSVLLGLVVFMGCAQQPEKSIDRKKEVEFKPTVFTINEDSLRTFTPGKDGLSPPVIVRADHSNKVLLRGPRPIIPGTSFLPQTKEDVISGKKPIKSKPPTITQIEGVPTSNTPGTGDFEKPLEIVIADPVKINLDSIKDFKTRVINNNNYTVQHGDTILPPLQVMARHLPSSLAKEPSYKDNYVIDTKYIDMDHGLSQSQVSDIVEARNGDMWLSYRGEGLSRYDGISFTHFGLDQGLNGYVINKIIKDKYGNIWIASRSNGIAKYDGHYFTWYTTDQGLPHNEVTTMLEKSNGDIIIGTVNGISVFNGKYLLNYNEKQGLLNVENIRFISEDAKENIWISTGSLTLFEGSSFHIYSQKAILDAGFVSAALEDKNGNLWFGTLNSGIYLMKGKSLINYATPQGFSNSFVTTIIEDKRGNIWFATYDDGIFKYDGASFTNYNTDHGLRNNTVYSITEDSGGKLWLGANGDGVSIFNPNSFVHFTTEQGLINNWASKIIEDEKYNLWFASWGGGLYKFDGEYYTHYTKNEGLLNNWVNEIITDQDKNIWVTAEYGVGGLSMFDQNKFTNYLIYEIIPGIRFVCGASGANGDLWFGTQCDGIIKCSIKSGFVEFTHFDHTFFKKAFISDLYLDKNENLWIGSYGEGIYIYDGIEFKNYNADNGLAGNRVNSFSEDEFGNMRIGTTDGLSIYNGSSFKNVTTKEGLAHNSIRTVVDDRNGNHWVSTRGGMSLLSKDYSPLCNFVLEDGLKDAEFKRNSGLLDSKNRLWWGTGKAITRLDLNTFENPKGIPGIKMSEIHIDNKQYDFRQLRESVKDSMGINYSEVPAFYNIPKDLRLDHKNNHLNLQYAGIDWRAPHQLEYQYILEGEDDTWSELTTQNSVSYRNLSQGSYTFKVKAIGAANKWSDTLEYSFVVHPAWWHTWWARSIYGLLIVLIVIVVIRLRTRSLLMRQRQLESIIAELKKYQARLKALASELTIVEERERRRIAVILHDNVSQSLALSRVRLATVQRTISEETPKSIINEVSESMLQAAIDTRKLIFDLSSPSLDENGLSAAISDWLEEQFGKRQDIEAEFISDIVPADKKMLDDNVRTVLFRNVRELLTNVVKHARANKVKVSLKKEEEKLKIIVEDNGVGFEKNDMSGKSQDESGFGLFSVQELMADLGGTMEISSESGKGTKVILAVPSVSDNHEQG